MAIVYCARSLVPSETKSTSARMASARRAAAGTSIITPTVRHTVRTRDAGEFAGLGGGRDHRRHDPQAVALCPGQGLHDGRARRAASSSSCGHRPNQAVAADARGRGSLVGEVGERQRLVGAGVERAHHHLAGAERGDHVGVGGVCWSDRDGAVVRPRNRHFGAEQARRLRRHQREACCVLAVPMLASRRPATVGGAPGANVVAERPSVSAGPPAVRRARVSDPPSACRPWRRRPRRSVRASAVDARRTHDAGQAQLPGDDRGVTGGSALLGDDCGDHVQIECGGIGRR